MQFFKRLETLTATYPFCTSIIKGVLAALLVATLIEIVRNDVAYAAERQKARLTLKVEVIRDFADKSYRFTSAAVRFHEVCTGNGSNRENYKQVQEQLRDILDQFRSAKHQFDIAVCDKKLSGRAEKMSDIMKKMAGDSLFAASKEFEANRQWVKRLSDSIESIALLKRL